MKSYTDLEQSKKLAEILPHITADNTWERVTIAGSNFNVPEEQQYVHRDMPFTYFSGIGVPCWSLAALMHLLPSEFTEKGEYSETLYNIDIRKYALTDDVDIYQIAYGNYRWHEDGSHSWSDMVNSGEREELIDACYEMILKLNEQKLL